MTTIKQLKKSFVLPKRMLNVIIILATLLAAVYYFYKHHNLLTDLRHVSPLVIIEVFVLYMLMLGVLIVIYSATMRLVSAKLKSSENAIINIYSLFMNFFIPGQTGPAFRAYYMKKNHNLKYLDYTLATIIYYLAYGVLSIIFVIAGSQPYYLTLPIIVLVILAAVICSMIYIRKKKDSRLNLTINNLLFILVATFCQVALQAIIYFVELHHVKSGIRFDQVITYAGTANLALFIALTPGAIGIREGFLILTEKLNHLSSATIVLANVIDRSVYIIFLLFLGIVIASLHIRRRLGVDNK